MALRVDPAYDPRMLPRFTERFEDWLRVPVEYTSRDPRVTLRRLRETELDAAFDLVDAAFGVTRPRPAYDWLYSKNPRGPARCVGAFEIGSGRLVCISTEWPWPAAHHDTALPGTISGDRATAPDWQRQGLYGIFRDFRIRHPWRGMRIAWPNALSRRALTRLERSKEMIGPLRRAVAVLDADTLLTRRGVPKPFARPLARTAALAQAGWERLRLGGRAVTVAPVQRFDARFDALTAAAMRGWTGYWCPHDAEFLNWRYLDHPTQQYLALAGRAGERITGYAVVLLSGMAALLMELVADADAPAAADAVLAGALAHARAAGCKYLEALASGGWPHWPLLRRAGFIDRPCEVMMQLYEPAKLDARSIDRWWLTPGDLDAM